MNDIRYALRLLWKSPAFSVVAIATLALGIGANTAIFSVIESALLRPLPFPSADRLVRLYETFEESGARSSTLNLSEKTRSNGANMAATFSKTSRSAPAPASRRQVKANPRRVFPPRASALIS